MSQFVFEDATLESAKLRLAMFGPSGSGKTYTALRIATGIVQHSGGFIAFIDTERRTARKYAKKFKFKVLELDDTSIDGYVGAIGAAAAAGASCVVIDSMSHGWRKLIEKVEAIAKAKYRGNTFTAWSEGNPLQNKFIDAILDCPSHIIATMRSNTAYELEKDDRTGKTRPVRLGLKPDQGKMIEYEFDMLMELDMDHVGRVLKDRSGEFQDQAIDKPDENFGSKLSEWLSEGEAPTKREKKATVESTRELRDLKAAAIAADAPPEGIDVALANIKGIDPVDLTQAQVDEAIDLMKTLVPKKSRAEEMATRGT